MIDFTRKAILATEYITLEIIPNPTTDSVHFSNTETDARHWFFSISKEEWIVMRNFIDKSLDLK
jgi:hypothetical protein